MTKFRQGNRVTITAHEGSEDVVKSHDGESGEVLDAYPPGYHIEYVVVTDDGERVACKEADLSK